jgi:predicted DNA-binding protein with PD1-like motif
MIVTQSHKRRSFVGCLNAGVDLVDAIRSLCVDNTIFCGFLQATGYLKNPKLRWFDAERRSYREGDDLIGTLQVSTLTCNISLYDRQTSISCHVSGSILAPNATSGTPIAGELVSGEVVAIEFALETIEDIRLYRARGERAGLDGWLRREFGQRG